MKIIRVLAGAFFGLLLMTASPAGAQSSNASPCTPPGQPSGGQYPPQCASPRASNSQVQAGGAVRVIGQCPAANSSVDFRLSPSDTAVGSGRADGQGNFDVSVTIPSNTPAGDFTIDFRCTGVLNAGFNRGPAIRVLGAAAARAAAGTLPRTGTGLTTPLAASAALLIGAGAVAVVATRRRRA